MVSTQWTRLGARVGVGVITGLVAVAVACGDDGGSSSQPLPTGDAGVVDAGPPVPAEFGLDVRPSNTTCKAPARP
jgi:hypothetical protein